jgi:diguanylate cyclase (GGDEF)-like protein
MLTLETSPSSATHDHVTGLPNRNSLHHRIAEAAVAARSTGRRAAVLGLDLDRFTVINHGYGHGFGDRVLAATAERLGDLVREGDVVARHTGDEFLLLLPDLAEPEEAHAVAQSVLDGLDAPIVVDGVEVHLGGSIGLSVFPDDGATAAELIDNADVAMYHAKARGRNTYQPFERRMGEEIREQVEMEGRLRDALANEELRLVYQPKLDLATNTVVGAEALLRWDDPVLGPVPPSRFIPIAEESGLIVPIGDWVLRTATAQSKAWLDAGLVLPVAVNVSAGQLTRRNIVQRVDEALDQSGLPARLLELELTESLLAQDVEGVVAGFAELRSRGVTVSVDDFGTGYSSLGYLTRLPVDALKIDQSFVRGMLVDSGDSAIVQATVGLAHDLGLRVVAEGVESHAQLVALRLAGCDEAQGYYISPPTTAPALEHTLRS